MVANLFDSPRWRALVASLIGLLGIGTALLVSAPVAEATTLATFSTAGEHDWTVPSGVTKVSFTLYGASGGTYTYKTFNPPAVHVIPGGVGAEMKATFAVHPGEVFAINVGGVGGSIASGSAGGFNGGGNGGSLGAGGGGASDVRHGSLGWGDCPTSTDKCDYQDRLIVAGGGGGASTIAGGDRAGGFGATDGPFVAVGGAGGFGQGGIGGTFGGGGGGGWWGGTGAEYESDTNFPGTGGSGYISPLALSGSWTLTGTRTGNGLVIIKTA